MENEGLDESICDEALLHDFEQTLGSGVSIYVEVSAFAAIPVDARLRCYRHAHVLLSEIDEKRCIWSCRQFRSITLRGYQSRIRDYQLNLVQPAAGVIQIKLCGAEVILL